MVAWSGKGWLVALCNLAGFALAWGLANYVLRLEPTAHVALIFALWGLLSGAGIFVLVQRIEAQPARVLIDPATNTRHEVKPDAGSFTWVPTKFWAILNPAFGLLVAVLALTHVWSPAAMFGPAGQGFFAQQPR